MDISKLLLSKYECMNVWGDERLRWWMSDVMKVWGDECPGWWMSDSTTGGDECLRWWMSGWWMSDNPNYQGTCSLMSRAGRCLGLWSFSVVTGYPGARDMTYHQLGHLRLWSYSYPVCCYSLSRGTQDDASLAGIARCRWRLINPTTNKHHLSQLQGYHNNLYFS